MFGGTFNPPHLGHMAAAKACVDALKLDLLLFVPTNLPPHKKLPEDSATPAQRLEMCQIAAEKIPHCQASDLELKRPGPSYTFETAALLAEQFPDAERWLVMGTDMLLSFDQWREPKKIASLCRLAVAARNDADRSAIAEKAAQLKESMGARIDILPNLAFPAASTDVRSQLGSTLLDGDVAEYIRVNSLYKPSLDTLRQAVQGKVSAHRYAHIQGCEKLAAEMGARFGAEEYQVRAAAILHDCTKGLSEKEQLILAEKWHIITDYEAADFPALIHADTGAEMAKREFRMPDAVADAIRTHTVGGGKAPMTTLQKILYVADMAEETRSWEGAEALRALALSDLHRAYISALKQTLQFIRAQGRTPYYKTEQALALALQESEKEETT